MAGDAAGSARHHALRERPELRGDALTEAISEAMVSLYAIVYQHDRTTATTYINDNVVVCVLEGILTAAEVDQIAHGRRGEVIDGRVAFQEGAEDEFTEVIQRLTGRPVTAFLSANQTAPGVACELFFLGPPQSAGV
ncbi:DUF2294 family protein [Thermoleophilia bacterium SCSIO 60948]|nr:DUF2294 family protein [Thermoleophilia bacterium SCSIO 60948]